MKHKKSRVSQSQKTVDPEEMTEFRENSDPPATEPRLYENNKHFTPAASAAPMVSSLRAQLRTDQWDKDASGLGYFLHQGTRKPSNVIEHYITSSGDISLLPWDEALQIIDKFGLITAKLHMIFAAHATRRDLPWESRFTLKASDIVAELGWDKRSDLTKAQKLNEVAKAAFALGCLLIKAVWVEGQGQGRVSCSVQTSRMWETAIDVRGGQLDLEGKIDQPTEVYITVRPGLWTYAFLNKAGCQAKQALYQFGYLAQDILKIDPYHDELALRLGLHLTVESRFHTSGTYKVETLLEALLPKTIIDAAKGNRDQARKLTKRWNHALAVLLGLNRAFQIEFDPQTYPDALRPDSQARKPRGYFEQLLAAKITIHPPAPIPTLLATQAQSHSAKPKAKPKRRATNSPTAKQSDLTGPQIRKARKSKGWSQAKLAGLLGISQRYVSMFERGDRLPSSRQESQLRKLLDIR
jgi:DNA-binding transcriptional regulator YiaG